MEQGGAAVIDGVNRREYSQSMDGRTEKILLDGVREGDGTGFEGLVRAHTSRMISLAYRLVGHRDEAEDIVQEAFLRLYRALPTFRGESSVATWLYRTVSNLAIDHLRREQLRRRIFFLRRSTTDDGDEIDPVEMVPDPAASPRDVLLAKEAGRRLSRALDKLSPRQRAVFVLRHQEELALKDIARVLELEEGTVKSHLHRAVSVLRKELQDLNEVS